MKKIIYLLLIVLSSAMTITSCTEENIEPNATMNGGGGDVKDPK